MRTIFALSTPRGRSGVAIIRVSGPGAFKAYECFGISVPRDRRPVCSWIFDPDTGDPIDQPLILKFEGPASYTGEDTVEFQVHGSTAVVDAILEILSKIDGFRFAEAGEFTKWALLNGRLDLVEVEGLSSLLDAETTQQRLQAVRQMSGQVSAQIFSWRRSLVECLALIEATVDFSDEDIPTSVLDDVLDRMGKIAGELDDAIRGSTAAERIRHGFEVALVGPPNSGKSTLLNCLARRDVAIVSEEAGTTRDILEVRLDINGLPVTVLDMAGIRESDNKIEVLGIQKAAERAEAADLRIFIGPPVHQGFEIEVQPDDILVEGKGDLVVAPSENALSGKTGLGIDRLLENVSRVLAERADEASSMTTLRQRVAVERTAQAVRAAMEELSGRDQFAELVAENLRLAVRSLDVLTGRLDVEDILDVIFGSFCIGK